MGDYVGNTAKRPATIIMKKETSSILSCVADYYTAKLNEHGETPRGVDWNGTESQELRFAQLTKCIDPITPFSLNDLGCGYGALYDHLNASYPQFIYNGWDISGNMIQAAKGRYINRENVNFSIASEPSLTADYGVASGIFNVRLKSTDAEWFKYIQATLDILNHTSKKAFAFNCLTSYSDADKMRDYLYYADPRILFDLCMRRYSRHVALMHDYGLYEFTIIVRKNS